jgi:hypothetical protein
MSANIIVYNKTGKLTALVGVMPGLETTPEEAEEQVGRYLRRYDPPYLVVVGRDKIYFWRDPARNPRPVGWVSTEEQLGKHLDGLRPLQSLGHDLIESVAYSWVSDLTNDASSLPEFARAIGFADAIYYGDLEYAA